MREVSVEQHLIREVERRGGECWKLVSPGNAGAPDRLILLPDLIGLLELKRPGKGPRSLQARRIERLQGLGHTAGWADSHMRVDAFLAALVARQRHVQRLLQENPWS